MYRPASAHIRQHLALLFCLRRTPKYRQNTTDDDNGDAYTGLQGEDFTPDQHTKNHREYNGTVSKTTDGQCIAFSVCPG